MKPIIDVIVPCYAERPAALQVTIAACLRQSLPPRAIYIVDDGSPEPIVLPDVYANDSRVHLLHQPSNQGISAARNAAAARSDAQYLFFLNCEILPDKLWLERVAAALEADASIGAACGRLRPRGRRTLLTAWRMRVQENHEERARHSGPIRFATGHAVMVRRNAFESIGGYNERYRRTHEDADLCNRLKEQGFLTYFVANAGSQSVQIDTLRLFAQKSLRKSGWTFDGNLKDDAVLQPLVPGQALKTETRTLMQRLKRNLGRGRLHFILIDFLVWFTSLRLIREFSQANQK